MDPNIFSVYLSQLALLCTANQWSSATVCTWWWLSFLVDLISTSKACDLKFKQLEF